MPNIQVNNIEKIKLPFKSEGFFFGDSFKSVNSDRLLIPVSVDDSSEFFLEIKKREKNYIIKADKLTMPPINIVHQSIEKLISNSKLLPTFSNINSKNSRVKDFEHLKNIEYFHNEFKTDREIWVEVGFGSGKHLLHLALQNPDIQFIGIEIHKYSIEQVLKQIKLQGIKNLLVIDYDARTFLEFLDSNSVGKVFVHFPVPWDKKAHRRVINTNFIDECSRVLKQSGELHLRTDSIKYYEYCYELFINMNKVNMNIHKNQDLQVVSKYESRWRKMEKNIFDIYFKNDIVSEVQPKQAPLDFDKNYNKTKIIENFKDTTIIEDDFFIHLEDLFLNKNNDAMIKVSFGSMQNHEHKYIEIKDNTTSFFNEKILPTKTNIKAYTKIQETLSQMEIK
ncbi:MAG: tRNA (guanine46-N7-)-methyltransferase (EC [uncultured Campylobacterales bacterium]|uniref:tRNA (guanine-N(7)-)-methyltransferase n=1 Tax=uncultured Campylobacterales bacterium TaxID=352960 RepID=A0A6S6T7C7_9BACT|nr:MAG: tRNA (guanine46-N7-)-methyltransferase (EC [uncultured Campylobacterales bacterium]